MMNALLLNKLDGFKGEEVMEILILHFALLMSVSNSKAGLGKPSINCQNFGAN